MDAEQLRIIQAPIKQVYREEPARATVSMQAAASIDMAAVACTLETPAGTVTAGLHPAAGGDGRQACSGDMLLQALVACSGVTFAAVATAMGIPITRADVTAAGRMDFRGTLGVDRSVPIGFISLEMLYRIESSADDAQLQKLVELTERYCVVLQTLTHPAALQSSWHRHE
jgi:uncharacterized OsmC-like protein